MQGGLLVNRATLTERPSLTQAGRRFLEHSRQLLDLYGETCTECREIANAVPTAKIHSLHFAVNITAQIRDALDGSGMYDGRQFEYRRVDVPVREALDAGQVDFAVQYEIAPEMSKFAAAGLRECYGWVPLKPQRLCFLVSAGNPLARGDGITAAQAEAHESVQEYSPSYESWYKALVALFQEHGAQIRLKMITKDPREGAAFPIGSRDTCLCTERFARYYESLDVEDVRPLRVEWFDPLVYPFLVYRRDNGNENVRRIIACMG